MQSEALQLATIQNFDIALVDYNLPIQNGLEVLQEMRKRQPGCVRILITGMLNEELAVEAGNRGEKFLTLCENLFAMRTSLMLSMLQSIPGSVW